MVFTRRKRLSYHPSGLSEWYHFIVKFHYMFLRPFHGIRQFILFNRIYLWRLIAAFKNCAFTLQMILYSLLSLNLMFNISLRLYQLIQLKNTLSNVSSTIIRSKKSEKIKSRVGMKFLDGLTLEQLIIHSDVHRISELPNLLETNYQKTIEIGKPDFLKYFSVEIWTFNLHKRLNDYLSSWWSK